MRRISLPTALVLALLLAGCGNEGPDRADDPAPQASSKACTTKTATVHANVDLDGDGTPETVGYVGADVCPTGPQLVAEVGGKPVAAPVEGDLPVAAGDIHGVDIQGRAGELVLVEQKHPRGGFQARLYGYADGTLEELTTDGKPVLPFVATDAPASWVAVRCVADGFDVRQARAHQPVGVVPAWDIDRTVYTVDGNSVSAGPTTEVADNVLDRELQSQYGDLVGNPLFANCLVQH